MRKKKESKEDLMLRLIFLEKLDDVIDKFEEKYKCRVKYNLENLKIKKIK